MPKKAKVKGTNEEGKEEVKEEFYPRIIGGVCEFCGIPAKNCDHFKEDFETGKFRCLCGLTNNPRSLGQLIVMYYPGWKAYLCNAESCRRHAEARGGYDIPEIYNFYVK